MDLKTAALKAIQCLDLTTLGDDDTEERVIALTERACTDHGSTAALCIYPRFIPICRHTLKRLREDNIRIATVTVFPHGRSCIEMAVAETRAAVAYGADEVDTVIPYRQLMSGKADLAKRQLEAVKEACGDAVRLKVILETGELKTPELIAEASKIAIEAGADFIKTSTGKVPVNATPEAAQVMLEVLKETGASCGLKIAGGVKSTEDARDYLEQAAGIMGPGFLKPETFRFGASGVLNALLATLDGQQAAATGESY